MSEPNSDPGIQELTRDRLILRKKSNFLNRLKIKMIKEIYIKQSTLHFLIIRSKNRVAAQL